MGLSVYGYLAVAWSVPLTAFVLMLAMMSVINKRVNWLLLRSVLGVVLGKPKTDQSTQTDARENSGKASENSTRIAADNSDPDAPDQYLYINFDEEHKEDSRRLTYIQRFLSDVLVAAILAIFVEIIFNSLILSSESVRNDAECPDFTAECFGRIGGEFIGPFDCKKNKNASFNISTPNLWCVGWVAQDVKVKDVLDTLGTCGGLLGIIASIVPVTYYLSYYTKCACPMTVTWILPCSPVGLLAFVVWYTWPLGPSATTVVVLSVVITMVFIGWSWAVRRSCDLPPLLGLESCQCGCFINRCCGWYRGYCCCECCRSCCPECIRPILTGKSKSYPWCCVRCNCCTICDDSCYECCYRRNSCCKKACPQCGDKCTTCCNGCLNCCCQREAEKFKDSHPELFPLPVNTVILMQPIPFPSKSPFSASGSPRKTGPFRKVT